MAYRAGPTMALYVQYDIGQMGHITAVRAGPQGRAPRTRWLACRTSAERPTLGRRENFMKITSVFAAAFALLLSTADAAEIRVLSTQATEDADKDLVAQFEQATGHKVTTALTGTLNVQKRLADGEIYDMIIMAAPAIDEQIKLGKAVAGSRVDMAASGTGMAVRKGAPKPDIVSVDSFRKAVLAAKS